MDKQEAYGKLEETNEAYAIVKISGIPDIISLWFGILLARFVLAVKLPVVFWWALVVITIFTIGSDLLLNSYYINKYGGSKWAILASILGLLAGLSLLGPPGIILGPG